MGLASFRIYLEMVKFDFESLPLTKAISRRTSKAQTSAFHRTGLYLSIGYVLLFAPSLLFS